MDLICFFLFCGCYAFMHVCLYAPCGHLLGKGLPLGSRLWCLSVSLSISIGILGQVWYLIESIPDLCILTLFTWIYKLRTIEIVWDMVHKLHPRNSLLKVHVKGLQLSKIP